MNVEPLGGSRMNVITPDSGKGSLSSNSNSDEQLVLTAEPGQDIVLSEPWFLRADFDRAGPDLVIKGPDGENVVIRDYFNQPDAPDIRTPDGVVLKGETASILAGPRTDVQTAQSQGIAQVEPIGTVETVEGSVEVTRADGSKVTLRAGDAVFQGDVIETGDGGAVGIIFADESAFSLGEDGRMVLDEMIYDPGAQEGEAAISLLQGAFTFVSGQIAKTGVDAMVIETPTATIGIRGTAGGGSVNGIGQMTIAIANERGQIVGEVTISTDAGSQTINQAFQAISVGSRTGSPSEPFVMTARQFGQAFGDAMKSLPNAENTLPAEIYQEAEQAFNEQQEVKEQAAQAEEQKIQKQAEADAAVQEEAAATAEAEAAATETAAAEAAVAAATTAEEVAAATAVAEAATAAETAATEEAAAATAAAVVAEVAAATQATKEAEAAQVGADAATKQAEAAGAAKDAATAKAQALEVSPESAVVGAADAAGVNTHLSAGVAQQKEAVQQEAAAADVAEQQARETAEAKQAVADAKTEEAESRLEAVEAAKTEAEAAAAEAVAAAAEAAEKAKEERDEEVTVATEPADVTYNGDVVDGYLRGATVFIDADEDGIHDAGETSTTTDIFGGFSLTVPAALSGFPITITGGVDLSTGLRFEGVMKAPAGSTVVTPLTTLMQEFIDNGDAADADAAQALVLSKLGVTLTDSTIDLRNYDPILESGTTDGQNVLAAGIKVISTVNQLSSAIAGRSGNDDSATANSVMKAFAAQLPGQANTGTLRPMHSYKPSLMRLEVTLNSVW